MKSVAAVLTAAWLTAGCATATAQYEAGVADGERSARRRFSSAPTPRTTVSTRLFAARRPQRWCDDISQTGPEAQCWVTRSNGLTTMKSVLKTPGGRVINSRSGQNVDACLTGERQQAEQQASRSFTSPSVISPA